MIKEPSDRILKNLIDLWLEEDLGEGDHTSLSTIPRTAQGKARLIIKQEGVIAGIFIASKIFHHFDNTLVLDLFKKDGDDVRPGDAAFELSGPVRSILQTERLVLNIMQRMSGIATRTRQYVKHLEGLHTKILDTRKTTPGMRLFEKEAVRLGGGHNHRTGLFDMILIKDNHIDFAGGLENAIDKVHNYLQEKNKDLKIMVEARSIEDIKRIIIHGGVDRILLDNFNPEQTNEAVKLVDGKFETESSGNITEDNIRAYAECGVDYISVGALTHQIKSLDMSLKAVVN